MTLEITIDNVIRFNISAELKMAYPQLMSWLRADLIIDNPVFIWAKRKNRSTFRIPAKLTFFKFNAQTGDIALPRGYQERFFRHLEACGISYHVSYNLAEGQRVTYNSAIQLRDYQVPAVEKAVEMQGGLIEAPCGSGKSEMGLEIIARHGQNAAWLTHTHDLANQVIERAERRLGLSGGQIGLYGAGKRGIGTHLTVALIPTLAQPDCRFPYEQFGLVMLDECFPAGTLIDDVPIEKVQVGDVVTAFDIRSGKLEKGRVTTTFKRPATKLLRIWCKEKNVVCTPNHPFYTNRGWTKAEELQPGDEILYAKSQNSLPKMRACSNSMETKCALPEVCCGNKADSNSQMCSMRGPGEARDKASAGSISGIESGILLPGTSERISQENQFGNNGQNEQKICGTYIKTHEGTEPNGRPERACQSRRGENSSRGLETTNSGRQRKADSGAASYAGQGVELADGSCGMYENAEGQRLSESLQTGYCEPRSDDSNRSGRPEPQLGKTERTGSEKRHFLDWVRVDRVEVLEPGSDGTFGGLCPDGYVYNFEVERYHTYVAEGFVVHNCHHSPASTWSPVINKFPAVHRYGVTATLERADGLEIATHLYVGPTVYKVTPEDVKDAGGTIIPKLIVHYTECKSAYWDEYQAELERVKEANKKAKAEGKKEQKEPSFRDYNGLLTELIANPDRNALIINLLATDGPGHYSLVLSDRVAHCRLLCDLLKYKAPELKAAVISGTQSKADRQRIIDEVKEGKIQVLFAVDIAKEGLDIPRLDRLYLVAGGRNEAELIQKVGRIMRPAEGKTDARIIDIVDGKIDLMKGQYYARRRVYRRLGIIS